MLAGKSSEDVPCSRPGQADVEFRTIRTHQFESGFSIGCYSGGLETILSRNFVIEPEERLMRLNPGSSVFLGDLKRNSQNVLWAKLDWFGFFGERNTKVRTPASAALALRRSEIKGDTYGSERICSPFEEETVNLGDWRVRTAAYVWATTPSSTTSIEDFMMKVVDEVTA
jgi:hypothetical protein